MLTLEEFRTEALALVGSLDDGKALDEMTVSLLELAVRASPSSLDTAGIETAAKRALDAGATGAQVHETLVVVSGLGVHTLMEGSRRVGDILRQRGDPAMTVPLDEQRTKLWQKFIGDDPYWDAMEREAPGFLDALLRLSPEAFKGFFDYCAIPWKTGALRAFTKELIALAVDSTPSHRYLPGARLHLANAIKLGAGRSAILQTLEIAAAAPPHCGVR